MPLPESFYLGYFDLVNQLVDNAGRANTHTAKQVQVFLEVLERQIASAGPKLAAAHEELAKGAQSATIDAYKAAIAVRNTPPYRTNPVKEKNRRYAGGALLSAIEDPSFAFGTEEGITFANQQLMDERAKQWHRLNFGAGGAAGEPSRNFTITWSNVAVASIGFEGESADKPFRLPKGFWLDGEGGGRSSGLGAEFYPVGEIPGGRLRNDKNRRPNPARNTRGIEAQHWLDAGVFFIAEHLPEAYENIYLELFEEARGNAGGQIEGIFTETVRPWGRPLSHGVL